MITGKAQPHPLPDLGQDLRQLLASRGFAACDTNEEIAALRALAQQLIPGPTAPTAVLRSVQDKTGCALYVARDSGMPCAFLALFAFTRLGERALMTRRFSGLCVSPCEVEAPHANTRTGYVWGFGGVDGAAGFRTLRALRAIRSELFEHIDLYARAASMRGRALMAPFGFEPTADASLFWAPAPLLRQEAA